MSLRVLTRVWAQSPRRGTSLLLELALADFADDDGWCWPSVSTLAKKARLSVRTTQNVLHALAAADAIHVEPMAGKVQTPGGLQRTNRYHLLVGLQGDANLAPPLRQGGADHLRGGANGAQGGAVAVAPKPSVEPSTEPSIRGSVELSPPLTDPSRGSSKKTLPVTDELRVVMTPDEQFRTWVYLIRRNRGSQRQQHLQTAESLLADMFGTREEARAALLQAAEAGHD